MTREPHSKYTFSITDFNLTVKWSDGVTEDLTWALPESLLNEIEMYLNEMEDLRTNGDYHINV